MANLETPNFPKKEVYRLLSEDGTYATVLHVIALSLLGPEVYEMDFLAIDNLLKEEYGTQLSEDNYSKLCAIIIGTSTDLFFEDPEAFRSICNSLTEGDPGLEFMEAPTVGEIAWALYELSVNRDMVDFQPPVAQYMSRIISAESEDTEENVVVSASETMRNELTEQLHRLGITEPLPPLG